MAHNPVCWFEIYVEDMERARRFYETVFQTQLSRLGSPDMDMWAFPSGPDQFGAGGTLVRMPGFSAGRNSVLVYFSCSDCAVETARIVPAGGGIEKEKFAIGEYGFIALAYDTEGNMFGLHSLA